ncbi:MAG TPA: ATP-binding cassette domain-containing protein [Vicinamibacterales bacterium]|nr:ATP-binding cassette domain-containing protein [Vicinamibacterales bacterium]
MIEVRALHMRFGAVRALSGVSLSALDGAITGLVGQNGAGKTTTLNIVSGLHEPNQGAVVLDGVSTTPQDRRSRIGALLDQKGLYSRLTARENVEYFGALRGFEGGELNRRTQRALTTVGLDSVAHRRTEGFSQGERMKVALARAIVHSPQHLLLDEPTNGLDVPSARGFKAALRRMRDDGVCVVVSSHMIEDLGTLCDSIVIIAGGRVVAQGSASDLCRQTRSATLEESFMVFNGLPGE